MEQTLPTILTNRKYRWLWLLPFLVAFLVRGAYVLSTPHAFLTKDTDALSYIRIGENIARHGEFSSTLGVKTAARPPLYPFYLAGLFKVFGKNYVVIRFSQALLDSLSGFLLFLIGIEFMSLRKASLGMWLYALHPVFIAYSGRMLSDTMFVFLWLAAIWLLLKTLSQDKLLLACAAGVFFGLSILCRASGLLYPALAVVSLFILHPQSRQKIGALGLVFLFSYLMLVPWTIRNFLTFERFLPVTVGGGTTLWVGSVTGGLPDHQSEYNRLMETHSEVEVDAILQRRGRRNYKENFLAIMCEVPGRLAHFWLTSHCSLFGIDRPNSEYISQRNYFLLGIKMMLFAFHVLTLILGACSLFSLRRHPSPAIILVGCSWFYYSLHVFVDYGPNRYHIPALALFVLMAAWCLSELYDKGRLLIRRRISA